jgi:hypothetical protein
LLQWEGDSRKLQCQGNRGQLHCLVVKGTYSASQRASTNFRLSQSSLPTAGSPDRVQVVCSMHHSAPTLCHA